MVIQWGFILVFVQRLLPAFVVLLARLALDTSLFAQRGSLPPVRAGDQVEYKWFSNWNPAEVVDSHESGHATLRDTTDAS